MTRYLTVTILVLLAFLMRVSGQQGFNYQMTMISNPSLTGAAGDAIVRISYLNHFPGNSFNLHSACLSADGFFPGLHGGAGLYVSEEYLGGIINELRGGFSYSYFLRATGDLYINAGLSVSVHYRGFNPGGALLPDQIDPLAGGVYPSAEVIAVQGRAVVDLASGFLFMYKNFFGGFSVSHLTEPDPSVGNGPADGSLRRKLLLHGAAELNAGTNLKIFPMAMAETGKGWLTAGAGASVVSRHLAVNALILGGSTENVDLQAGFSIDAGYFRLFYNYRFNIISGEELMPFSLMHHTGLAFSLYNVDKRKIIKTINFPDL
jgi:type IX secretion system PorP/SprF family membrane protein